MTLAGERTDFEQLGLARERLEPRERSLLLTIDFEAFTAARTEEWVRTMHRFAEAAASRDLAFSIFLAVEDVVRLGADSGDHYRRFGEGIRALADAGCAFHPHNHCVFDRETGRRRLERLTPGTRPGGYEKRPSMFYDVVYRNHEDLSSWLRVVRSILDAYLEETGVPAPERPAFRPGGWDHGSSREDIRSYLRALDANGFVFNSSASSGSFGTRSWRLGAPFGQNVFQLVHGLVEVAPCWSFDGGRGALSRHSVQALLGLAGQPRLWAPTDGEGTFVVVLHFDHLFRGSGRHGQRPLRVWDAAVVDARVDRLLRRLSALRSALSLRSITFEGLELNSAVEAVSPVAETAQGSGSG